MATLKELAAQYKECDRQIMARVKELHTKEKAAPTDSIRLHYHRRARELSEMAYQCRAIGKLLDTYYTEARDVKYRL